MAKTTVITGTTTICPGGNAVLDVVFDGVAPFSVTFSDGIIVSGILASSYKRLVSPETTTEYTIASATDSEGALTPSGSATITVNAVPTAEFDQAEAQTMAPGGEVDLSIVLTGTAPWDVEVSDGELIEGILTSPHTYTVSPESDTEYSIVSVDDATGCEGVPGEGTATVDVLGTAVLSGDNTICDGGNSNLHVVFSGVAPFSVTFSDNVTISGINESTLDRLVTPSETNEYTILSGTDANGDIVPSGSATITINPAPTAEFTQAEPVEIQNGESVDLTITLTGTAPWSVEVGELTIENIESSPYTWTITPEAPPDEIVTTNFAIGSVYDANGCEGTPGEGTAEVTVIGEITQDQDWYDLWNEMDVLNIARKHIYNAFFMQGTRMFF